jgi:hypothetical protein
LPAQAISSSRPDDREKGAPNGSVFGRCERPERFYRPARNRASNARALNEEANQKPLKFSENFEIRE